MFRGVTRAPVVVAALALLICSAIRGGAQTLPEALDDPYFTWATGGTADWSGQADISHDGIDAAQSGDVGDNETSWIEVTINSPGTLSFWWTVSSEPGVDRLALYLDGELYFDEQGANFEISGELGGEWYPMSLPIPAGTHVVQWAYVKDESVDEGADTGWLDEVTFVPDEQYPPQITTQPQDLSLLSGDDASLTAQANGSGTFIYQWRRAGTNLVEDARFVGVNTVSLLIRSVLESDAAEYSVVVSNEYGGTLSSNAVLTVTPSVSLGEALDAAQLVWSTGGDVPWWGRTTGTHDGVDVAQTGTLGDEESCWMETSVSGPGRLSFWWKTSSERNFDSASFAINGIVQTNLSGQTAWRQQFFDLGPGSHTLRWAYQKDIQTAVGQDRAWVDQVSFVPDPLAVQCAGLTRRGDGAYQLTLTGTRGRPVQVWGSTNLVDWESLAVLANPAGTVVFVDPETNLVHRAYRASVAP